MSLVTRDDVATPYSTCKTCKRPTRSHVLEPALYEEYIAEVVINSADEYANKQWEETEEVVKVKQNSDPIVVCHNCWVKRESEIKDIIEKEYKKWSKNPLVHIHRIQVVAEVCHYYKFESQMKTMKKLIKEIKESKND